MLLLQHNSSPPTHKSKVAVNPNPLECEGRWSVAAVLCSRGETNVVMLFSFLGTATNRLDIN